MMFRCVMLVLSMSYLIWDMHAVVSLYLYERNNSTADDDMTVWVASNTPLPLNKYQNNYSEANNVKRIFYKIVTILGSESNRGAISLPIAF